MEVLSKYRLAFEQHLSEKVRIKEPNHLYEPIQYIVSMGGKRLRPLLTLFGCDIFREDYHNALDAALAIELFHNFSLVHDDIMDEAPLRRGEKTVHSKWDLNTGILSGDAMLILAYQTFENYEPLLFQELVRLFSKTALEVCEGQQFDVDFESRDDVSISEYIKMIEYKTAVLIGAALKMGAIVANASEISKENLYSFGRNLGIAFQLQDDYLDAFGNPEDFGKQIGGDIISNKKTFLFLTAISNGTKEQKDELCHLFSIKPKDPSDKINTVKTIFQVSGASEATKLEIKKYTELANECLAKVEISQANKNVLQELGNSLMIRSI